jgi:hypothetical protein
MVVQRYTLSLHEKSLLRPMLEAWRGQKLKADELEGLEVIHNIKDGGEVYTRIQAVVPPAKGASKLRICRDYIRVADREKRADCERIPNGREITDADSPFSRCAHGQETRYLEWALLRSGGRKLSVGDHDRFRDRKTRTGPVGFEGRAGDGASSLEQCKHFLCRQCFHVGQPPID